jgi:hypothetical protein
MQKHYFELDKVDSITITMEKESLYRWFFEIPARPKTFLGIQYGMTKAIPAGWSDYKEGYNPKPSSYFDGYKWYRVDEVAKKIYNKAYVEIRFGYKQSIGKNFESNEEAQAYVDELILSSDKKFTLIINK